MLPTKVSLLLTLPQSQNGEVTILPARPQAWPSGRVSGIRARGDITVSIDWDTCGAKQFVLTAGRDGPITVRSVMFDKPFDVRFDKGSKPRSLATEGGLFRFQARKSGQYTFVRNASACD